MVVDKTQFDKYRKRSELDAEKNTENKFVEFRCAKFSELNAENHSEKRNFKNFALKKTETESLCEKSELNANKKISSS